MKKADAAGLIARMSDEIKRHDTLYYCYGAPAIEDHEYDSLITELAELEKKWPALVQPDSPTQRVGGSVVDALEAHDHPSPMFSIDNCFDLDEVKQFNKRVIKKLGHSPQWIAEWKLDGCAVNLLYEDGVLRQALTRGDAVKGDEITNNARAIRGIPHELTHLQLPNLDMPISKTVEVPGMVEVRGEAFITHSDFTKVNIARVAAGEDAFTNSRSATAGALRSLDSADCHNRKVRFVAHGIGAHTLPITMKSYFFSMWTLHALGMPVSEWLTGPQSFIKTMQSVSQMVDALPSLDLPVDGIVLKLDQFADRKAMGQVSKKHVSWALAYKWERYEAETQVDHFDVQVGKQGTLTPVVYVKPVEIAETTVQKASLHNWDEVKRLDIATDDYIIMEKAGKIIPHVVRVLQEKRPAPKKGVFTNIPFSPPSICPSCDSHVAKEGPFRRCTAKPGGCPAQVAALIRSAADRSRLDIDGLGETLAAQLAEEGLVSDLSDLWTLEGRREDVEALDRVGKKKADKLFAALRAAREQPSWRLMASLNIKHCGRTTSELVCKAASHASSTNDPFKILEKTWDARSLVEIDGVGEAAAASINAWFCDKANQSLLLRLRLAGLNFGARDPKEKVITGPRPLDGMKVCATGKLIGYSRDGIKDAIINNGGVVASGVSAKTDLLVAGDKAGSKLVKAEKLGVKVVTEAEFDELLAAPGG